MKKRQTILHLVGSLQIGGMEMQSVQLVNHMDIFQFRPILCVFSGKNAGPLEHLVDKNRVMVLRLGWRIRHWPLNFLEFSKILVKENVQIIHTHGFVPGLWGRFAAWFVRVPVVISHEHGKTLWKKRRHYLFERVANRFTDMRIAVSDDILRLRVAHEKVSPEKIITIPNGVDPSKYGRICDKQALRHELNLNTQQFVIGTVGRLTAAKDFNVLIDAFQKIVKERKEVRLLLVGDGELREQLQNYSLSKLKDLSCFVRFLGSRSDIQNLLQIFDIFVISSKREGLPVALLEAMASGIPVVATRVGGIPEVIQDNVNGLLVPPNNAEILAEKILFLLEHNKKRQQLGCRAYETIIEKYSINRVLIELNQLYLKLLNIKNIV